MESNEQKNKNQKKTMKIKQKKQKIKNQKKNKKKQTNQKIIQKKQKNYNQTFINLMKIVKLIIQLH